MNKQGIAFNIVLTVVSLALAFSSLPLFKEYVDVLLTITVAGNVILHIWFPGNTTTITIPTNSTATTTTTVETPSVDNTTPPPAV